MKGVVDSTWWAELRDMTQSEDLRGVDDEADRYEADRYDVDRYEADRYEADRRARLGCECYIDWRSMRVLIQQFDRRVAAPRRHGA